MWIRLILIILRYRLLKSKLLFSSRQPQSQKKDYALLLSFVGQARLQFAGLHSLFLAFWCIVIEIDGAMRRFAFLESDVSISCGYLLVQMPLWQPLYLHWLNICCCRCSFLDRCIYKALIFIVADALFGINVSATCSSLDLQMLFSLPGMYKLHLHLAFSGI